MSAKNTDTNKLAEVAFDDALTHMNEPSDGSIDSLITAFEAAALSDEDGVEYWFARDLQELLGYEKWDNFVKVIDKAKVAAEILKQNIPDHFADIGKMVELGSGSKREIKDIKLTRYASYLIAQNAESSKKPVAFAQTYFAIQTRRQEIQDDDIANYTPLSEDQKRVLLRNEIKEHNKNLASAAKNAGVILPLDFAIFQTFGYKGLYGGLDRAGIQRAKGLKSKQNILDHMGSTELAANLFRATQTEEKLRRDNVKGKHNANAVHLEVGKKVRQAIKDIGGTMPENLPQAEDIVKVGKRMQKAIKATQDIKKIN